MRLLSSIVFNRKLSRKLPSHNYFSLCLPKHVDIIEVGLRDGLQNEKRLFTLDEKRTYLDHMVKSGIKHIEIGSFVSPKWVPQMANTTELIESIDPSTRSKLYLSALVPNMKGLEQAIASKVDEVVFFVSTTDQFNKKNINKTQVQAFEEFRKMAQIAHQHNIKIRGSISCCFKCPYEGYVDVSKVIDTYHQYKDLGAQTIDIADTIGAATPVHVDRVLQKLLQIGTAKEFSVHFHDTNNLGIMNVQTALEMGITSVQSSLGGSGGCPYASKRVGNLSTQKLLEFCFKHRIHTGVNINDVFIGDKWINHMLKQ